VVTAVGLGLGSLLAGPAVAALAIVAHPSNNLAGISSEEAAEIYLGQRGEFPNGRRATPVEQASGSAARTKFYKSVVKRDEGELKAYWSRLMFTGKAQPPRELADDAAVKAFVSSNPEGIGYIDGKSVDGSVKVLLIIP
jgi:ABC-type phosphate transport system substrate-binding protein